MPYASGTIYKQFLKGQGTFKRKKTYKKKPYVSKKPKTTYSAPVVPFKSISSMPQPRVGFGNRTVVKMSYFDVFVKTVNAANISQIYDYSLNGINDPDLTLGGHQPMMHDQLSAIYERYTVLSTKYTVQISGNHGNSVPDGAVLIVNTVSDASSPGATLDGIRRLVENGMSQNKIIGTDGDHTFVSFTGYVDQAKINGLSRSELISRIGGSTFGSDPGDVIHLIGMAQNNASVTTAVALTITVQLEYEVLCEGNRITGTS